jgi:hypothetical protein
LRSREGGTRCTAFFAVQAALEGRDRPMREFPSLSQADLVAWSAELVVAARVLEAGEFVLVVWGHTRGCPLHPSAPRSPTAASRCDCGPDGTAVVNPGDWDERRMILVRGGRAVSGAGAWDAGRRDAADPKPS